MIIRRFYSATITLVLVLGTSILTVDAQDPARDKLVVETLVRLKRFDVSENEKLRASVTRHLDGIKGSAKFVEYVKSFSIKEAAPDLIKMAIQQPDETIGVDALTAVLSFGDTQAVEAVIKGEDSVATVAIVNCLGKIGSKASLDILIATYKSSPRSQQILIATTLAISKTFPGQLFLIEQAEAGTLPKSVQFAVGNALYASINPDIKSRAKAAIKLPATADSKPLPPISELITRTGNATGGKELFFNKGTCAKCHKVGADGKEVGPALTEIGSKLSSQALFTAILDPSAGVSHNYETYSVITLDGNILTGIKLSATDTDFVIRTAEGIDKRLSQNDIDEVIKTGTSLMPADLQRLLSVQELTDIVAYLKTLVKD